MFQNSYVMFVYQTCESMKVGEQVSERRRHHEKSETLDATQQEAGLIF